jgi:hypothetical protein
MFFSVLDSLMQTKKHSTQIMAGAKQCSKGVGLHYNVISLTRDENESLRGKSWV